MGKGVGRQAVRLLLDDAFRHPNLGKVWLRVHSSNDRAIRCHTACGFSEEGRLRDHVWSDGRYVDLLLMSVFGDNSVKG